MRNWREWFIDPEDETPVYTQEDAIRAAAGSGHKDDEPLQLKPKPKTRCCVCKRYVGFSTGMHLMITQEWRIHVSCFAEVLERHYELGEVIDLETGAIRQVDKDTP